MMHRHKALLASTLLCLCGMFSPVWAERADRDKPVDIEADRLTVDDRNKVSIFEGNVVLTQGTLVIRGDKLVVTQDAAGFQQGVATATGSRLASFRQRRDRSTEYVDGEAARIEYDSRSEKARLFERARVSSGGDKVTGDYIEYDAVTETYLAKVAPGSAQGTAAGRVRAVIQPKPDNAPPPARPE